MRCQIVEVGGAEVARLEREACEEEMNDLGGRGPFPESMRGQDRPLGRLCALRARPRGRRVSQWGRFASRERNFYS